MYKELAIIDCTSGDVFRTSFRLNLRFCDLSFDDSKSVAYVTNYIHGIPFENFDSEIWMQDDVSHVISAHLKNDHDQPILVGYKGGTIERNILRKLGFESYNLELINCPKYNDLIKDNRFNSYRNVNCNIHLSGKIKKLHCAAEEVQVFNNWLNFVRQKQPIGINGSV